MLGHWGIFCRLVCLLIHAAVLCIYNGEWQPEKFPVERYISDQTKSKSIAV